MIHVVVLVPVLGRPERAAPLVESLAASVTGPVVEAKPVFVCSPGDDAQIAACVATGSRILMSKWAPGPGDYAKKINLGFHWATLPQTCAEDPEPADFCLLGADDLVFHPGWVEAALIVQLETGACVVGTNDLGNASVMSGSHATHPLVHRNYYAEGVIDESVPGLLYEGYDHNFCDTEFVGTAKHRGTFAAARLSYVEHMHPIWGKGDKDDTYEKGQRAYAEDKKLWKSRRSLWADA